MANQTTPELLQRQQIPDLPSKMFYIPNFISEEEEQRVLEKVDLKIITMNFHLYCLTRILDPCEPLDFSQTPSPPSHPCPAHSEQHSARLNQDASLAHQPHC
jgi:hypothetical protein